MGTLAHNLEDAFNEYVAFAKDAIREKGHPANTDKKLVLIRNRYEELREIVNDLEKSDQFNKLTSVHFSLIKGSGVEKDDNVFSNYTLKNRISTFFKKSRFYVKFYQKEPFDEISFFNLYVSSIQKISDQILLIPLEYCSFSKPCLDFDSFQIIKFEKDELDDFLANDVAQYFYPYYFIDTDKLKNYHFLIIKYDSSKYGNRLGSEIYHIDDILSRLLLFNWVGSSMETDFSIPFYFQILAGLTQFDITFINPDNRRYVEFSQVLNIGDIEEHLDHGLLYKEETDEFELFVKQIDIAINEIIEVSEWKFVEVALAYFVRGFWATDYIHRILCFVTAIEALIGENGERLVYKLKKRISAILGDDKSNKQKEEIKKIFEKVYRVRSDVVHGNKYSPEDLIGDIKIAREFARELILWFVQFLNGLKADFSGHIRMATRDEILLALDIDPSSRPYVISLLKSRMKG